MRQGLAKIRILLLIGVFSLFTAGVAEAFVPIPPHLVKLVVGKIKRPAGLEVEQVTTVYAGTDEGKRMHEVKEHLIYSFPGKLRRETVSSFFSGIVSCLKSELPKPAWIFPALRFSGTTTGSVLSWGNRRKRTHPDQASGWIRNLFSRSGIR
jgi:hypothetical protein